MTSVVCLHSSASTPRQWRALAEEFGGHRRCLAPALIGYGPDSWPGRTFTDHCLNAEVDAVLEAIQGQSDPIDLVGHSYGGAVALEVARRIPGRIASLTVYEPVAFSLLFSNNARRGPALEAWSVARTVTDHVTAREDERAAEVFVDYWSGQGAWQSVPARNKARIAGQMTKVAAEFKAIFGSGRRPEHYAAVTCPTLIIRGSASPEPARVAAEQLRAVIPNSELMTLPGLGHMAPVTHAERVNIHILGHIERWQHPALRDAA